MKSHCSRLACTSVLYLPITLAFLVGSPIMHGQAFDPGPRLAGSVGVNANCPLAAGTPIKFGVPGLNCFDLDQPPSQPPQPPADGAGNLIGETTIAGGGGFAQPLAGMWFQGISIFETVASVTGVSSAAPNTEPMPGLGPSFNAQSCFQCHSQPAVGGSSPGQITIAVSSTLERVFTSFDCIENPEIIAAHDRNATNTVPSFVQTNGPVIEARFVNGLAANGNAAAVLPGQVGELFTIQGRTDEPANCSISQLNFNGATLAFRIPTPTFGLGLVENTPELVLQANLLADTSSAAATTLGIKGSFNTSGNDGTITRFGWKAQNKSLLIFAGEAENVEMGVTNELFPDEKTWGNGLSCISNLPPGYPEDQILSFPPPPQTDPSLISSVAQNNAVFMRMNGAPSQCDALTSGVNSTGMATCLPFTSSQVITGQSLFSSPSVGCNLCHSPTLTTSPSINAALSNQIYHPYSDFALHHMGITDADGVTQGAATSDQFRTAPLWGVGQRFFLFHDGRATDLNTAIQDHCPSPSTTGGGEACGSVRGFNALTTAQQQDILDFLRSL